MNAPDDFSDLEARLRAALRAEGDRTSPVGDGLARIRARTAKPARLAWFQRPAFGVGALAFSLVAATVIGLQFAGGDDTSTVVEPARQPELTVPKVAPPVSNPEPEPSFEPAPVGPEILASPVDTPEPEPSFDPGCEFCGGGELDIFSTPGPVTEPDNTRRTDGGIPEDTGGNYVAITAPFSGSAVGQTFSLEGQARVFEANVTIDVSQNGQVLQQEFTTASTGAPEKGTWSQVLTLAPGNYRVDAYALSPEDGATKLASDTIWITVTDASRGEDGAGAAPDPAPEPAPEPAGEDTAGEESAAEKPAADAPEPAETLATDPAAD